MKKIGLFLFLAFGLVHGSELEEANRDFTYKGQPIHPGLIQQFEGWLSDSGKPITTAVDVAAAFGTNQYPGDDVIKNEDWIRTNGKEGAFFQYKWLGKLEGDHHVLVVCSCTGGSGIFESLYFCKFHKESGDFDGEKYQKLILKIEQKQTLGDHDDANITIKKDKVVVGKSKNRDTELILKFNP